LGVYAFGKLPKGAKISYGQCGEDIIVAGIFSMLQPNKKIGKYIDIGAHHPTLFSNTFIFYKKGWRGINVDPLKDNMRLFQKKRPKDTNICAGIGNISEEKEFFIMDSSTLSTCDASTVEQYRSLGHAVKRIDKVPFMTISDLITRYGIKNDIDILNVDIEGNELAIIQGFIENGISPHVVICETIPYEHYSTAKKDTLMIQEITQLGYFLFADTWLNSIFVSNEFWTRDDNKNREITDQRL